MKVEQWLSRAMTVLRNLVFISPFWLSFVLALAVEYYQVAIKVLELCLLKIFSILWWWLWIFIGGLFINYVRAFLAF